MSIFGFNFEFWSGIQPFIVHKNQNFPFRGGSRIPPLLGGGPDSKHFWVRLNKELPGRLALRQLLYGARTPAACCLG